MVDLQNFLLAGPLSAAELLQRSGVSQATLSRQLRQQPHIIKWGRARATRYALLRPIQGENQFPLYCISAQGQAMSAGYLLPTWPQGSCLYLDQHERGHFYDGLPWFLQDLRPQGFIGRQWGREHAAQLGLNDDIRLWSDEQCLMALANGGIDMPGAFLIGERPYQRWLLQASPQPIREVEKVNRYPQLAQHALSGDEPGSSAGGEQPKFLCFADTPNGARHCLVKFTASRQSDNAQRWRDLLRAEHLALRHLNAGGLAAADSQLIESEDQLFLEVQRFDRTGERGRHEMASLEAVSAEFIGHPQHWPDTLRELHQQRRIDDESQHRGTLQWAFGRLIANSDMHAGNLSFFTGHEPFSLTPAYDMLPMALAPNSQGHMREEVKLTLDFSLSAKVWRAASAMAKTYWQAIESDEQFSLGFRQIAAHALQQLTALAATLNKMA
ncbi:type II toxin-antitoxin system HipA family toxin YjjJ [Type-D symbiont of Plautia stali]|uniref:type II toxin-antitoxin system HipA family toxin YjjJ n=1 Tax=Type-D symbiont of Plautia stali TaxID=1560356 RepID=UPI00073E3360|nr:type II toxin-antitoxin system HipA family toxin YjjJ [Type-D symbiont of Plautia stali]